ncbi:MAG: homocysteine S-methyltransferase family protein [Candidatus Methylomirabilis oxyfera]|nr:homocysteine S-methyltransferase family protein [Candidatus Methylomirabilis oxyfera]
MSRRRVRATLVDRLSGRVLILDGGMGISLQARGLPRGHPPDLWSVEQPEEVRLVHEAFVEAGADIIFTNTFGASRLRLDRYGWGDRVIDLNRAAVGLARAVAKGKAIVAGDIGPCGPVGATFRQLSRPEVISLYAEQIQALASAGVDLLVIETISDLEEMKVTVTAARSVAPDLPVLASLTFTRDGVLRSGEGPAAAARALEAMGVDIVGANCSFGFASLLPICEEMAKATTLPLAMKPSAGVPPAPPPSADEAAEYARRFVEAGAALMGGCCGVDPAMLRAIALAIKGMPVVRRPAVVPSLTKAQG